MLEGHDCIRELLCVGRTRLYQRTPVCWKDTIVSENSCVLEGHDCIRELLCVGRTRLYQRTPVCWKDTIVSENSCESEYAVRVRERNVLFNDALNTFYLRLYGIRHMVKDHSDSEKGNPLPPHRLLLSINSKGSFMCTIPQTG